MPPWLLQLIKDSQQQNSNSFSPAATQPPTRKPQSQLGPPSSSGSSLVLGPNGRVSGGDMADVFAGALNQQNQADTARSNFKNNLFFGRHLGVGGGEISPSNPTGDPRDAFNNPAFFAGNQVDRAAKAVDAQPLWSNDASGRLVHGSNYPGANGPTTPVGAGSVSDTLAPMGQQEQQDTLARFSPPTDAFTDRGLGLTPFGQQPINPNIPRPKFVAPPPPPPPPPQES